MLEPFKFWKQQSSLPKFALSKQHGQFLKLPIYWEGGGLLDCEIFVGSGLVLSLLCFWFPTNCVK